MCNLRLFAGDLIDTQWNVNLDNYGFGTVVEMDLIDTQWNVNNDPVFNELSTLSDLIDTQWNVNSVYGDTVCGLFEI